MNLKNILKSLINFKIFLVILIISLLIFIVNNYQTLQEFKEGFDTSILFDKSASFCENNRGSSANLDKSCGNLTQQNCNSTSCCNWTSDNKCVAGNKNGPTFNTDSNGKTKTLDYYYFQNKCYGSKCSTNK